jgi:hypothetical protein
MGMVGRYWRVVGQAEELIDVLWESQGINRSARRTDDRSARSSMTSQRTGSHEQGQVWHSQSQVRKGVLV